MTTGGFDPNTYGQDPNALGRPGGYPPPPPPGYQIPNPYDGGYAAAPGGWGGQQPGGLGVRFGARFIDGILVGILSFVLGMFVDADSRILVTGLFTGLLTFIYFVALEMTQGHTLGKKLLGLTVHGPGGAPRPDFKQSAIRNAFTLLPILPYFGGLLGVIAIIVIAVTISNSPTKQGKHDEMAGGTQVVKG